MSVRGIALPEAQWILEGSTRVERRAVIWPRFLLFYSALHCLFFTLYALLGKGFAYAGWPPFYVSELLLILAIPAFFATRRARLLFFTPIGGLLLCFVIWEFICTVPFLGEYGIDALRDSVIWGYSVFACVVAAMILRLPRSMEITVQRYRRFARFFMFLGPAMWLATLYLRDWLPVWPGTSVSIPLIKGGDYDVHLAGIFAFAQLGLGLGQPWWVLIVLAEGLLGVSSRSGLVALLVACVVSLVFRPRIGRVVAILGTGITLVLLMEAFEVRFTPSGAPRELSIDVLSDSLVSIVKESDRADLEGTKTWRLTWWRQIWNYTVNGSYFWMGKGYGVNLADSDGFQVGSRDEPLRSPHNSHLTFLARSGMPGFILWVSLQTTWAISMLRSYFTAKKAGLSCAGMFGWVLVYWIAFVIEAGFDVSLEGPMAGIPFWTVFGIGWASQILLTQRHFPLTNVRSSVLSLRVQG